MEIVIAAADTCDELKMLADYVCMGSHDEETWRRAMADLASTPSGGKSRIKVLGGNYLFEGSADAG